MRLPKKQQHYKIALEFRLGIVRTVSVKASTREVAESRALKRHPEALGVKRA